MAKNAYTFAKRSKELAKKKKKEEKRQRKVQRSESETAADDAPASAATSAQAADSGPAAGTPPDMSPEISKMIQEIALLAVPVLMAITFHEVAHGYVANWLGDPTARLAGRLTLNPIRHLDVLGVLAFVLTRMRPGQRELLRRSPLGDTAGLARALQEAYDQMFALWLTGQGSR